ncbi:MAG TPA: VCBS repeat-containing protein, partial [Candidatus Kryptonia bacterium]|nr:VCBS repeat-containing protein [Candidatus Kryptonia bacterium]
MRAVSWRLVVWGLLWPSITMAQAPIFDSAMTTNVSGIPSAVVVGDVDGDGHLDVVSANADSASVTLLVGDGTGALSYFGNFPAGSVPSGMVMGLIDGDNVPDLVVSNANMATLTFLHGTRNPDDCPQGQPACFVVPQCDVVGDPTCPGTPIALPGYCTGDQTIPCDPTVIDAQHRDQCTLAGKGTCSGVGGPGGMAIGDLNGDAFPDLAVAAEGNGDADGTLSVLFGHGDGTYNALPAIPAGSKSSKVVIADFNGDNKNDIAVANTGSNDVAVFLGDGAGHFGAPVKSAVNGSPTGIAAGDFDEDSHRDLVVSFVSASGEGVAFLKGDGHGNFTPQGTFGTGSFPSDITAADLNGDHHLDVVVSNKRSADASVLLGDGHGSFAPARTFVSDGDPLVVAVADLNEDQKPDVLVANGLGFQQGDVAVLLNGGAGRFVGVEDIGLGAAPSAIATGDLDNDARPDLALAFDPQTVRIFLATDNKNFLVAGDLHVGDSPRALSFADFNRDGNLDLAVINSGTDTATAGSAMIFLGNGDGTFKAPTAIATPAKPVASVVGDFDNNRIPDLAIATLGSPGVVMILLG